MIILKIFGKETLAKKLVISLCERIRPNSSVLLVDTISGSRILPIHYGVQDETIYDVYDFLNGDVSLFKSVVEVDDNFSILASSYLPDKISFKNTDTIKLVEEARDHYNHVLMLCSDEVSKWELGDGINIHIYSKDSGINSSLGTNKIVIDNTENILKDQMYLEELEQLSEMGYTVIGVINKMDDSESDRIYDKLDSTESIEYKTKGIITRIKEVFIKND